MENKQYNLKEVLLEEAHLWQIDLGILIAYQGVKPNPGNKSLERRKEYPSVIDVESKSSFYDTIDTVLKNTVNFEMATTERKLNTLRDLNRLLDRVLLMLNEANEHFKYRKKYYQSLLQMSAKELNIIGLTKNEITYYSQLVKLFSKLHNIVCNNSVHIKDKIDDWIDEHKLIEDSVLANLCSYTISYHRKMKCFNYLKQKQFISSETTYDEFNSLFGKAKNTKPISWINPSGSTLKTFISLVTTENKELKYNYPNNLIALSCFLHNGLTVTKKKYKNYRVIDNPIRKKSEYKALLKAAAYLNNAI